MFHSSNFYGWMQTYHALLQIIVHEFMNWLLYRCIDICFLVGNIRYKIMINSLKWKSVFCSYLMFAKSATIDRVCIIYRLWSLASKTKNAFSMSSKTIIRRNNLSIKRNTVVVKFPREFDFLFQLFIITWIHKFWVLL